MRVEGGGWGVRSVSSAFVEQSTFNWSHSVKSNIYFSDAFLLLTYPTNIPLTSPTYLLLTSPTYLLLTAYKLSTHHFHPLTSARSFSSFEVDVCLYSATMLSSSPLSQPSPGSTRLSPHVAAIRRNHPYTNYPPSITVSHAHPERDEGLSRTNWTGPHGYGARHKLDDAPFSLWDEEKADFRLPTDLETKWLITKFQTTGILFQWPIMVIQTNTPPRPLPLTAGAVPVRFIPSPSPSETDDERRLKTLSVEDERPLGFPTDYAGMRGPADPLLTPLRKWILPTDDELTSLVETFQHFCNTRVIYILCPHIIVELHCDDQRTYRSGSLPRTVGGYTVHYHHDSTSAFEGLTARARAIKPDPLTQDTSNYLSSANELCPGVRLTSATTADDGSGPPGSMSTTAGVLLRDNHGNQRLTVANHGFENRKYVFHPFEDNVQIGEINERWEHLDIALVKLNPSVKFNNSTYFESKVPKRLLRSHEIRNGVFFSMDGMSTGIVFLMAEGIALDTPNRPAGMTEIRFSKWTVYRNFGAVQDVPREGVCGAAIVEDDTDEGGVAGFFQMGNANFGFAPVLDEFIDRSWSVV